MRGCRRRSRRARRSPSTACRPGRRRGRACRSDRPCRGRSSPNTPLACASSTIMMQPNSSASSHERRQRPEVAVHAEHAVGDEQLALARRGSSCEDASRGVDVLVREHLDRGAAQAAAVDDAGVVQLVGDDDVVLGQDRGDGAGVGGEAALEHDAASVCLNVGEPALELHVDRHRAGDGAHRARCRRRARSTAFERRLAQPGVRRQARGSCSTRG